MAKGKTTTRKAPTKTAKRVSKPRKPKWSEATERAYRYASEVAAAKHAPKFVRQQCASFADGLPKGDFPYEDSRVKEAVWFFEGLPVPLGNFGKAGRIELAPAQVYWAAELYGRMNPKYPTRRLYKEFYLITPRKSGKSTFGAAMCLKEICDPDRNGPLAQCAGKTRDYAFHVYDRAKKMVNASKSLRNTYAMTASNRQIKRDDESGALMLCEPGNLKDGSHPVIATLDELHDIVDPHPIQVLRSSFAATPNPLLAKFTTAGYQRICLGIEEREIAIQNFKGTVKIDNHFNMLYEWDDELGAELEDGDPRLWEAIHPTYHHTVEPDFYDMMYQRSLVKEDAKAEFNHKLLCKWIGGNLDNVIDAKDWNDLPEPPPLKEAEIAEAWIGVDGSELHDLTSITMLGKLQDGRLCAWWKIFLPRSRLQGADPKGGKANVMIPQAIKNWHGEGWIEACGEKRIDFKHIANEIAKWIRNYNVKAVVVDQFSGNDQIFYAMPEPFKPKMIRLSKFANTFTPPTQELLARIEDREIYVERNPVAAWCASNAVMESKVRGTMLPKKMNEKSIEKIDALDSLLLAIAGKLGDEGGRLFKVDKKQPIEFKHLGFGGRVVAL